MTITKAEILSEFPNMFMTVRQFGATGDGTTDDTTAIQAAITAAVSLGVRLYVPAGTYKISSSITIAGTLDMVGAGILNTNFRASGNFAQVFNFTSTAIYCYFDGITIVQTGTSTRCVTVAQSATVIRFNWCSFLGNLNGDLVYSNGDNVDFSQCTWTCNAANTWGVNFDCYNQNCGVTDCRLGGIGLGVRITNAFSAGNRVEGLRIQDTYFICTGIQSISIGNSFLTLIENCVIDQCTSISVQVSGAASRVSVIGNWIGMQGATGNCLQIDGTGVGHIVSGNQFYGGNRGVAITSTAGTQVSGVLIANNIFDNMATDALELADVLNCTVTGNLDRSATPASGSWVTTTAGLGGSYIFGNNVWSTHAIASFDTGSIYKFGNERGLLGFNRGQDQATAVTTLVISHGLITTPRNIIVTPSVNTGAYWVSATSTTTFTLTWVTNSSPLWYWQAQY